ncbi:MAG: hypothetical protein AB1646_23045 [Thermodesulfobacteriota bacterium]
MEDTYLTPRQRKWIEASDKIGKGPMTPSERKMLEGLYAEMTPAEQEELANYIQDHFGKTDPIRARELMPTKESSPRLKEALVRAQRVSPPPKE